MDGAADKPAAGFEVDLAEFGQLRDEINNRTQIAFTLIVAELTGLGAGLSVIDKVPDVLLGLAAVSGFLWLLWLDMAGQVHKIAAYLALHLAPRLRDASPGALGWEAFYREVDAGGARAAKALGGDFRLEPLRHMGRYLTLLFLITPVVLLGIYVFTTDWGDYGSFDTAGRIAGVLLTLVVLGFAYVQSRRYDRLVDTISRAIAAHETP